MPPIHEARQEALHRLGAEFPADLWLVARISIIEPWLTKHCSVRRRLCRGAALRERRPSDNHCSL
jgi:hypothetical protein